MTGARWTSAGRRALLALLQSSNARDVARRVGCDPSTVSLLASGASKAPKLELAIALADHYGIAERDWLRDARVEFVGAVRASVEVESTHAGASQGGEVAAQRAANEGE